MNNIHELLHSFISWLDYNSIEYNFNPHDAILDFKEDMKKDLFNKLEIIVYKGNKKIVYGDLIGVITYFNNEGDCIEVNIPNTCSLIDVYNKIELICISLNIDINDYNEDNLS